MENKISIKNEFLRKIIHLSNSGIAFMLLLWSQMTVVYFVVILIGFLITNGPIEILIKGSV